jgi:hypothetical protein
MKTMPMRNHALKPIPGVTFEMSAKKASTNNTDLARVSNELERLHAIREQVITDAFGVFEKRYVTPAALLLQHFGDQKKAARWMCSHQKVFDGRTAYNVIAEGDDEMVWDEIQRMARMISTAQYA